MICQVVLNLLIANKINNREFVEEHFVFNEPIIKKQDSMNEGKGYGTDKRKLINFMFQVDKPSRKDMKSWVESWCIANLDRID